MVPYIAGLWWLFVLVRCWLAIVCFACCRFAAVVYVRFAWWCCGVYLMWLVPVFGVWSWYFDGA